MANCADICAKIADDLIYDCDNKSVGGVEQVIKLINRCDINPEDWTKTSPSGSCDHSISYDGADPSELEAVQAQGIPGKRLLNASFTPSDEDFGMYFTHSIDIFAQGLNKTTLCNIKNFANGAEVVAIVEQKNKGENGESAFLVYGFDSGLRMGDFTYDANENNGSFTIPLESKEGDLEPNPPYILSITDYETTKTFFESL